MIDDLYFLPILAQALGAPRGRPALRRAFVQIETMGTGPRYRRGYRQYLAFMKAVAETSRFLSGNATTDEDHVELERPNVIELIVERDREPIASLVTDGSPAARTFGRIKPGHYRLRLDSGWALWEGELSEAHLLWEVAFPGEPLRMAADTGRTEPATTLEVSLLGRTLRLRVYPGVSSGYLELELATRSGSQP